MTVAVKLAKGDVLIATTYLQAKPDTMTWSGLIAAAASDGMRAKVIDVQRDGLDVVFTTDPLPHPRTMGVLSEAEILAKYTRVSCSQCHPCEGFA